MVTSSCNNFNNDTTNDDIHNIDTIVINLLNKLNKETYESSFNRVLNKLILTLILSGKTLFDIKNPLSNVIGYRLVNENDGTLSDKIHYYEGRYFTRSELRDYITEYKAELIKSNPDTVIIGNDLTEEQLALIFSDEKQKQNSQNNPYFTLPVVEIFGRLNSYGYLHESVDNTICEEHYLINMFAELLNLTEEHMTKQMVSVYDNNLVIDYNIDFYKLNSGTYQTVIDFASSLPSSYSSSNNTYNDIINSLYTHNEKTKLYNAITKLFKYSSYKFEENEWKIINKYNKLEHYPAIIKTLMMPLQEFCRFNKYTFYYENILFNIDDIVNYIKTYNINIICIKELEIKQNIEQSILKKINDIYIEQFIDNFNIINYLLNSNEVTYSIQIIEGFDINMLSQTNITNLKLTGIMPFSFNNYIINIPSLEKLIVGTMTHIELSPEMVNLKSLSVNTEVKLSNTVASEYDTLVNPTLGKLPPNIEELNLYYTQDIDVIPEDILKHFGLLRKLYVRNLEFDDLDDSIDANGILINFWDTPTIINMYFDDCFCIIPDKYKNVANKALKRINETMDKITNTHNYKAIIAGIDTI